MGSMHDDDSESWLTILGEAEPPAHVQQARDRGRWVRVRCRCNAERVLRLRDVERLRIRSCGCMAKAAREERKHRWSSLIRRDIAKSPRLEPRLEAAATAERKHRPGAAIRTERVRRGLSQQALCASCGMRQRRLSRIELGQREMRASELVRLCAALQVSADTVLGLVRLDAGA